jgi:hypothetical protein
VVKGKWAETGEKGRGGGRGEDMKGPGDLSRPLVVVVGMGMVRGACNGARGIAVQPLPEQGEGAVRLGGRGSH